MHPWLMTGGGAVLLYLGAEWFVGGASALALLLRVPQLLIGLTVVAYGTSAPEIVVGVQAAAAGHGQLAVGNVIGSNIANIGLILAVAALIRPARVDKALARRELPMLLASVAAVPLVLWDGEVQRWEAGGLLTVAVAYTAWMIWTARTASLVKAAEGEARAAGAAADEAGAPKRKGVVRAALTAAAGLALLLLGGSLFVQGGVELAQALGISDRLVGLTIVAIGTSLPELVTSAIAAYRGHSDLAVGNVVGSNIFNVFLCLGGAALAGPVTAPLASVAPDIFALVAMTGLAAALIRSERTISRREAAIALAAYLCYMIAISLNG